MPKALFVGCDVISETNTLCLMDEEGKAIGYQTFPDTFNGAKAREVWLLEVMNQKELATLNMATKVTSFLDIHLKGVSPFPCGNANWKMILLL